MVKLKNNSKIFLEKYFFWALIILAVAFYFLHVSGVWQGVTQSKKLLSEQSLLEQTNQVRDDYGLATLKVNPKLSKAAKLKVEDMFECQYWNHISPKGVHPWYWFEQVGYKYSDAGENLAKNFHTTDDAILAWMNSVGHRENILYERYREVGFAVKEGQLNGKKSLVVVALYGLASDKDDDEGVFLHSSGKKEPDGWSDRLFKISRSITLFVVIGLIILLSMTSIAIETSKEYKQVTSGKAKIYCLSKSFLKIMITIVFVGALVWFYRTGQII